MKHILTKYSFPDSFQKVFDTEYDARQELLAHICGLCLKGGEQYLDDKGNWVKDYYEDEIPDIHSIDDLLGTACGCEFGYEEVGE